MKILAKSEGFMPTNLPQILGIGTSVTHLLVLRKMRKWEAELGQHTSALYFPYFFFCKCFVALMVSHRDKHIHKSVQLLLSGFYATSSLPLISSLLLTKTRTLISKLLAGACSGLPNLPPESTLQSQTRPQPSLCHHIPHTHKYPLTTKCL